MNKTQLEELTNIIEEKVAQIWHKDEYPYDPDNIVVAIEPEGKWVDITISSMYHTPGLKFEQLLKLSEFFKTQRIDTEDEFSHGGCETCDYGSSYGFTLRILPPTPNDKKITMSSHGYMLEGW